MNNVECTLRRAYRSRAGRSSVWRGTNSSYLTSARKARSTIKPVKLHALTCELTMIHLNRAIKDAGQDIEYIYATSTDGAIGAHGEN